MSVALSPMTNQSTPLPKTTVVVISHSSVVDVYQDKLRIIARDPAIDLHLIVPDRYREGSRVVEASHGDGSFAVHPLPTRFGETGRQNLWWFRGLGALLRTLKPHIIHVEEEPESIVTLQITRLSQRLAHPPILIGFTWRNMPYPLPGIPWWHPKRIVQNLIQRSNLYLFDAWIAGSHESESLFRSLGVTAPMPIIPQYGVSPERFFPQAGRQFVRSQLHLPPDSFLVGYVGRILKMKGLATLIEAMSLLPESVHCLVLGSGDDEAWFASTVQSAGLTSRIHRIKAVQASQVAETLAGLDALVLPSLTTPTWKEQFGRVLIEAMACGVPVVGSSSGEIPFVISSAGMVFPEGNPAELATLIRELQTNTELRRSLSSRGLEHVTSHYTNDVIAMNIVGLYQSLLPQRSRQ